MIQKMISSVKLLTFRRCLTGAHFPYDFGHRKKTRVSASFERYSASLSGDKR